MRVVYEHIHRYLWAARLVEGRRVLDLGSGEGFGAAILAEAAAEVIGVDIDERTVEHSRLNYAADKLRFDVGSGLDLGAYDDDSFGAVVAFETIEHVRGQQRVLDEVQRVLNEDGILIISTPERWSSTEASGRVDPFHEPELGLDEFPELLQSRFEHVALWGQRTITGSHLNEITDAGTTEGAPMSEFFLQRAGEEWRLAGPPAPHKGVALASRVPLPAVPASSTLADCGLALVCALEQEQAERVQRELAGLAERERESKRERKELITTLERQRAEHVRALRINNARVRDELGLRDSDLERRGAHIATLKGELRARDEQLRAREDALRAREEQIHQEQQRRAALEVELDGSRELHRRMEESVSWRTFEQLRGRVYDTIGESSLLARALRMLLRAFGRVALSPPQASPGPVSEPGAPEEAQPELIAEAAQPELIEFSEYPNPAVSLIIPVYEGAELTKACLESIRDRTTHVSYEVIVVNDGEDPDIVRLLAGLRGARVIHNGTNLGYLRSVNRAASIARGRWLVLLNNDTEASDGWLRAMLECAESTPDLGVVTPKYLYPDGSLNEAGGIVWRDGTGANYGRGDDPTLFRYEYRREVDYGSAAALMVKAELWRAVGGFDERYLPMYYEDVDLCFAARDLGFRVVYEPRAVVIHVEGGTAGVDGETGHKRHQEQNRPKFVAKWRERLEREQYAPGMQNLRIAADRHDGPHVLVIDFNIPTWDRDAGRCGCSPS